MEDSSDNTAAAPEPGGIQADSTTPQPVVQDPPPLATEAATSPTPRAEPDDPSGTEYTVRADGATIVTFPNGRQQVRAPRGSRFLRKVDIQRAQDISYEDVHVPEWADPSDPFSGWVRCKGLTSAERGAVESHMVKVDSETGKTEYDGRFMREWWCAYGMVDETLTRLFSNKEVHQLGAKSSAALDRCFTSITEQSRASKKDLREMVGNLNSSPSDGLPGGMESE